MPPFLKTFFFTAAHLLAVCVCTPRAAAFPDYGPKVTVAEVPSFVIADKGVRHQLKPFYTVGIPGFPIDPTVRICRCTLVSGPAGTSVSQDGLVEWIPANAEIGNTANLIVNVSVTEGGQEIFTVTKSFSTTVLPEIPQLLEAAPIIGYEKNPIGWSGTIFSGFQPRDAERKLFRWSLISPPPGVYIDVRLMVPSLRRGLSHQPVVEASENLVDWSVVTNARWEALEMVYFPHDGSNYLEYFHPVVIPASANGHPNTRFIRLSVPAQLERRGDPTSTKRTSVQVSRRDGVGRGLDIPERMHGQRRMGRGGDFRTNHSASAIFIRSGTGGLAAA